MKRLGAFQSISVQCVIPWMYTVQHARHLGMVLRSVTEALSENKEALELVDYNRHHPPFQISVLHPLSATGGPTRAWINQRKGAVCSVVVPFGSKKYDFPSFWELDLSRSCPLREEGGLLTTALQIEG